MALTVEQIQDLVTSTQQQLGRLKWTDISYDIQEHVAMPMILKKEKVTYDSGKSIDFNLLTDHNNSARNVGLYGVDNVNVGDGLTTGSVPWRHTTADYAFDRREISMNRSPSKIVDLLKVRRTMGLTSLAARMESNWWGKPTDSNDDDTPFGIDYWIVGNSSEGFNGGNPAGFSAGAAGISTASEPRWANWTAQYSAVTKTDLVRKWRKAMTYTNFKAPVKTSDYNTGTRYSHYTNYSVIGPLEESLEAQNDNLGNEIAAYDGQLHFRRVPVKFVPQLDADATNPVYGVNWGVFNVTFLKGEYMHEEKPEKVIGKQHTVFVVHIDNSYNFVCRDRRRQFKLSL